MDFSVLVFIMLAVLTQDAAGGGRFITTLLSYTEYQPLTTLGEPCDSLRSLPCDRFYLIKISPESKKPLVVETPVIRETDFERVPAFVVRMDRLTSVSYEIAIFDRDDSNPSPLRTQSSSLGVVAVNGFDLDSTKPPVTLALNTSESFHGITLRIEVECERSFFGSHCDIECTPTAGQSGHFSCGDDGSKICSDGWTDPSNNCMTRTNPCDASTCFNGGVCVPGPDNNGRCQCARGFTGLNCETNVNECECNPCSNGGRCVESITPGGFTCECTPGWTGQLCQQDFDECTEEDSCPFGVSCINTPGSFTCCVGFPLDIDITPEVPNTRPPLFPRIGEGTPAPRPRSQPSTQPSTTATTTRSSAAPSTAAAQTTTTTTTTTPVPTNPTTTTTTAAPVTQTQPPPTPSPPPVTNALPTQPPRFVTAAPRVVTPAPSVVTPPPIVVTPPPIVVTPPPIVVTPPPSVVTTVNRFITQPAPNPNPSVQQPGVAGFGAACGNPPTSVRNVLISNLYRVLQQRFNGLNALNLQNIAANPRAMAANLRSQCGVNILGGVFANPRGMAQITCTIRELSDCLHGPLAVQGSTGTNNNAAQTNTPSTSGTTGAPRYVGVSRRN